jgi:hypothetical protein
MNEQVQTVPVSRFGIEAIAGALERLNCPNDQFQDHTQGNYGAWDNA